MSEQKTEMIEFDGLKVAIHREPNNELYIALQPPEAQPYIVAPNQTQPEEIVAFVNQYIVVIRELREEMLKRHKKTKSLKCHYKTGDVAYLIGRPFMLRVTPLSSAKRTKKGTRGRARVKATMQPETSVINLSVINSGDYDQCKLAFLAFAKPVFARNVASLLHQCMERVFPGKHVPETINCRPMRETWVKIDETKDTVWFSESLIPYPANSIVYAYLVEAIKVLAPDANEEERHALLDAGVPNWRVMKQLLSDPESPFTRQ